MSDTDYEDEMDEMDGTEDRDPEQVVTIPRANIRQLEKSAKRAKALEAEAAAAKRELAFLKAGIDTSTKLGALFFKSYDAEDLSVDAIKAEARELGILPAEPAETPSETDTTPLAPGEDRATSERQALATGATGDTEDRTPDPRVAAVRTADEIIAQQGSSEDAFAAAFQTLVGAAQSGDERVIYRS